MRHPRYDRIRELIATHTEALSFVPGETPLVSVCMQTFNHAAYVAEAIEGVLRQRADFGIELLIGDDGSTDGTREIILRYQREHPAILRVFFSTSNLGKYTGNGRYNLLRNLAAARGRYLAICEGDDYWTDREKLARQVAFLESHPDHALSFHRIDFLNPANPADAEERAARILARVGTEDRSFTAADTVQGGLISTCSVVFRREPLLGELPPFFLDTLTADWLLWLLACGEGRMRYLARSMGVYRLHSGGVSQGFGRRPERLFRDRVNMLLHLDRHFGGRLRDVFAPAIRFYLGKLAEHGRAFGPWFRVAHLRPRIAWDYAWGDIVRKQWGHALFMRWRRLRLSVKTGGLHVRKFGYRVLGWGMVVRGRLVRWRNRVRAALGTLRESGIAGWLQQRRAQALYREDVRRRTEAMADRLRASGVHRLVVFGSGQHTRDLLPHLPKELEVPCIVDDRASISQVDGIAVVGPTKLSEVPYDAVLLSSRTYEQGMYARARSWGIPAGKLFTLYWNPSRGGEEGAA
jgi:glycosyltransferase involved in cell wall biosynthesis